MKTTIMKQKSTNPRGMEACLVYTLFSTCTARGTDSYGVAVENEITGEYAAIANVTECMGLSECLFHKLLLGCVTPVCLKDVVEDFVADN